MTRGGPTGGTPLPVDAEWFALLNDLIGNGSRSRPRGLGTLELRQRTVVVDASRPVLLNPARKLSYRFMAAEAYWILSGSDRVDEIAPWGEPIRAFSDDGETFFGAYGPRFVEGLPYVLAKLAEDPDTRQAGVTFWRPNPKPSKDIPCLDGGTIVRSPEGDVTIAELSKRFARGLDKYPVYGWNPTTRRAGLTWMRKAWKTGRKKTVRVTFDDGSSIDVTPGHRLWRKTRHAAKDSKPKGSRTFVVETAAGDLRPGDRVWAVPFLHVGRKCRPAFIEDLSGNWAFDNQRVVHSTYYEFLHGPVLDGFDVHHVNGDVDDNRGLNLEAVEHGKHAAIGKFGADNPIHRETFETRLRRRLRLRATFKNKGYDVAPVSMYEAGSVGGSKRWKSNHVVVSVEALPGASNVYDFTTDAASCVVGTGVLVHNCTVALFFRRRKRAVPRPNALAGAEEEVLDVHAFMRSSDAWLGFPYDVFNFCAAGWRVAAELNAATRSAISPGALYLTMASSHLYDRDLEAATAAAATLPGRESPTVPSAYYADPNVLMGYLKRLRDSKPGSPLRWWEGR